MPLRTVATSEFGISPIVFGVVFCMTAVLGLITPPVGTVLFIAAALSGESVARLSWALLPYVLVGVASVLLIIFVPTIALVLSSG